MTAKNATAGSVATVVPSPLFSYSRVSFLDIFGTVAMKLVGGGQRLDGRDASPNVPFELNIEVKRESEGTPHVESSVFSGRTAKVLGTSLLVVILAIVLHCGVCIGGSDEAVVEFDPATW